MTPKEIIRAEYGDSRNFITPRLLGIGKLPGGAYEYSQGTGIEGEPVWAISVVWLNADGTTRRDTDLGQLFHSPRAAMAYVRKLKRGRS